MNYAPVWDSFDLVLQGLWVTVYVSAIAFVLALVLGLALGVVASMPSRLLRVLIAIYVFVFRGTPLIVLLFLAFFGLPQIGLTLSPEASGILALGLNSAAYITEIVRSAISSVDASQYEASALDSAGLVRTMTSIIIPQAARLMVAPSTNEAISLLKNSSLLAVISVGELTRSGQIIAGEAFVPFEAYTTIAVFYLIITALLTLLARYLEKRLAGAWVVGGTPAWVGRTRRPKP